MAYDPDVKPAVFGTGISSSPDGPADPADASVGFGPYSGPPLGLTTSSLIDGECVSVIGELDMGTVPRLRDAVARAFWRVEETRGGGPARLVLDLREVTFLDVRAVHALTEIRSRTERRAWRLHIVLPIAQGPLRMLAVAAEHGWIVL